MQPETGTPELRLSTAKLEPTIPEPAVEARAKIIEFPRLAGAPGLPLEELAGPVIDHPRILEVPEVAPPPPALGGMVLEQQKVEEAVRRPGIEIPLRAAPPGRRLLAALVDALIVAIAVFCCGFIFVRVGKTALIPSQTAIAAGGLFAVLWAFYQYLLLVHAARTPGLKLAGLRLANFDGSPASRRLRRSRVIASWLSGLSVLLGYLWYFLDEDRLCWHDRITHTYMASLGEFPQGQAGPKHNH
jgi:uncharacterized RDD family membrane protein YckC